MKGLDSKSEEVYNFRIQQREYVMLEKILIDNFRGITQIEIDDLQRINLLVGKNNSGKTSILEAIFLLTGAGNPELPLKINHFRGIRKIDEDFWRSLFNDFRADSYITLKGESENPKEKRLLLIKPNNTLSDKNFTPVQDAYSGLSNLIDGLKLEYTVSDKTKKSEKINTAIIAKGAEIEFDIAENYQKSIQSHFLHSERLSEGFTESFDNIQIIKKTADVVNILRKIEPAIENLLILSGERVFCDIGLERLIPVNMMGDGILRILLIIVGIYNARNGILLIDNIENGFHYSSQEIVWNAIIGAAREFNVQIFAATHSIECIRALSDSIARSDRHGDIRLFRIERKDKQFKIIKYNQHHIQASLSSDWEVR